LVRQHDEEQLEFQRNAYFISSWSWHGSAMKNCWNWREGDEPGLVRWQGISRTNWSNC
jgi:hypothetical protein